MLGGAVGDEVDRFDVALGSPEHAYLLGTSTGLGNEYQLVIEDLTLSLPGQGGAERLRQWPVPSDRQRAFVVRLARTRAVSGLASLP